MAKESDKVRLPELPVFKRFSLALRQEYASADEILSVLERTVTRINSLMDQAGEARRREAGRDLPPVATAVTPEEFEEVQTDAEEEEVLSAAAVEAEVTQPDEARDDAIRQEEIESLLEGPETDVDSLFPLEEEGVDSFVPAEADEISTLIRPESEFAAPPPAKDKPKPRPKRKRAQPQIVRVSKLGKPIGLSKASAKPAKPTPKSTSRNLRPKSR